MYTHHRFDHEFERGTPLLHAYAICSVPRSGSSLLCELLMLSGVAGAPTEYLDAEQAQEFARVWGASGVDAYLHELRLRKTGPNGVFGLKVHFDQMADLLDDRPLTDVFPGLRVVHLRRSDTVAQAVSYATARRTGQWASTHTAQARARYRRGEVTEALHQIRSDERRWAEWFDRHDLDVLEVEYEELVGDPAGTVHRVMRHVGITDPASADAQPTLERQRGLRDRWWALRYRLGL